MYCSQLSFSEGDYKKKFGDPTLVTPPWSPQCTIFLPQDIFHVERTELSENQKMNNYPWFVEGVTSVTPRAVSNALIKKLIVCLLHDIGIYGEP